MNKKRFNIFIFALLAIFTISVINICFAQEKVVDALYKSGLKKYILGNYEEAISDFESALKLDPQNIKVKNMYFTTLVKLGNIEYGKGDLHKARYYYEKALKVSAGNKDIKDKLTEVNKLIEEKEAKEKTEVAVNVPLSNKKAEEGLSIKNKTVKEEIQKQPEVLPQKTKVGKAPEKKAVLTGQTKNISGPIAEKQAPSVIQKVQLPFDIEKFIERQNEENRKMLESIVKSQKEERQAFINENRKIVEKIVESQEKERKSLAEHIKNLTNMQREDRKFFSLSLLLIIGGGIVVILIIIAVIFLFLKKLARATRYSVSPEYSIGLTSENYIKEIPDMVDESRLITDERYSDVVKAKRLKDLYLEFKTGDPSWESLQEYITEVNTDIKDKILDIVEKKLNESGGKNFEQAYQILMPLITDGSPEIRNRSKRILTAVTDGKTSGYLESPEEQSANDPLSIPSLMGMAKIADMKTKRPNHSIMVAEASRSIAEALDDSSIEPNDAYKVGLAHDIGYMELPAYIFKENRNLTDEEFEIIKTHPIKGVNLLSSAVQLPRIFIDGIKYHHERIDGSGYPEGLEGNAIPLIARIVAVADFFVAITSSRSYRAAKTVEEGLDLLRSFSGKVFDSLIVDIFIKILKSQG